MTPKMKIIAVAIAAVALLPVCLYLSAISGDPTGGMLCLAALGMALLAPNVRDANISTSDSLPASATHIHTTGIDLGVGSNGQFCGGQHVELLIEAPALLTTQLADAATVQYEVFHDTDSAFGSEVSLYGGPNLTQTGASSAGCAAKTKRVALPTDVKRYVRVKATLSVGDCSASKVKTHLVF